MKSYFSFIEEIVDFPESFGAGMTTDRVSIDGLPILYAYREMSVFLEDSGWRFFAGVEDQDYLNEPRNSNIFSINTIANHDPSILQILSAPINCAFERDVSGQFRLVY